MEEEESEEGGKEEERRSKRADGRELRRQQSSISDEVARQLDGSQSLTHLNLVSSFDLELEGFGSFEDEDDRTS